GFAWAHNKPPSDEYLAFQGRVIFTGEDSLILTTNDSPSKEPKTAGPFILARDYKLTIDGKTKNSAKQDLKPADFQDREVKVLVRTGEPTRAVRVKSTDHSLFGALSLALIFVLWTYAGWHEASYIAAEVRNPRRNLPLALWGGTAAVIALYLLVNVAYLTGLGYEAAADAQLVAADVLKLGPWTFGEKAICLLIMISSLGAVNGIIFTSSRIFSAFGSDHTLFAPLGQCNRRFGTPAVSLLVQGGISVFTILMVACFFESQDSFDEVVKGTAPVFWLFFLLTGVALFALRRKDRNIERPFTVPLYPLTPLVYCAFCAMMLYGSVAAAFEEKLSGWFVVVTLLVVLAGVPLYLLSRHQSRIPVMVQQTEDHEVQTI
ncbi:MAG TPA: APC family permease, partial [Gemmataceae bacterium]|nr:APC family permease [Gemmataceae bacterium]